MNDNIFVVDGGMKGLVINISGTRWSRWDQGYDMNCVTSYTKDHSYMTFSWRWVGVGVLGGDVIQCPQKGQSKQQSNNSHGSGVWKKVPVFTWNLKFSQLTSDTN